MVILQYFFEPDARTAPHLAWELVETDHDRPEDVLQLIEEGRMIHGRRLISAEGDEPNTRRILKRIPISFKGSAILRVQGPTWAFVEAAK